MYFFLKMTKKALDNRFHYFPIKIFTLMSFYSKIPSRATKVFSSLIYSNVFLFKNSKQNYKSVQLIRNAIFSE